MSTRIKKQQTPEPSIREMIGITAAEEGKISGAETFMRFVSRELIQLGLFGGLPKCVAERLQSLAQETEGLCEYLRGYQDATERRDGGGE